MPKRKRAWIERREDDRSIDLFDALAPADFCPCSAGAIHGLADAEFSHDRLRVALLRQARGAL
jgi:hypothetical protein